MTKSTVVLKRIACVLPCLLLGVFWQTSVFSQPVVPPTASTVLTNADLYVKIIGGAITGLAALIGLPIVFLTFKKTQAEIKKLSLEANALEQKLPTENRRTEDGRILVNVENSPNVHVEVLADPRLLAPLLVMLDFIFASVVLSLINYALNVFSIGILRTVVLVPVAAIMLLPIATQVLRVRNLLRPSKSPVEVRRSIRQAQFAIYATYLFVVLSSLMFGILLLVNNENITEIGRVLLWITFMTAAVLLLVAPILKPRLDRYLESLLGS
jgi:hypothetical protein